MLSKTLILGFLLVGVLSGIIPNSDASISINIGASKRHREPTINPNDIFKQVQFLPLVLGCEPVDVDVSKLQDGKDGQAYHLIKDLYPSCANYEVKQASYIVYGISRVYTFVVSSPEGNDIHLNSAVSDDADDSSYEPTDGFQKINPSTIYNSSECSQALKDVQVSYWSQISPNAVSKASKKQTNGNIVFRFSFKNVPGYFEHDKTQDPNVKHVDDGTVDSSSQNSETASSSAYVSDDHPFFTVSAVPDYSKVKSFQSHKAYSSIVNQFTSTLGKFDPQWILNVSITSDKDVDYFKISINFQPFLVKQDYEAQYYGNIDKAALLKIDQSTFSSGGDFSAWNQIKDFSSYTPFKEADQYIQAQFTWLRFYIVTAAYTALHLNGRYIRLVYSWNDSIPLKWNGNQINMVIYAIDGKYYMDRNDFYATNTYSAGRTDWVSLFVKTPDVPKYQYYGKIVQYFQSINPKFWRDNQLQDIYVKNDLHVIILHNPTNDTNTTAVCSIKGDNLMMLNQWQWVPVPADSPLLSRLLNFVNGKYAPKTILFQNYNTTQSGNHYEIGYLDSNNQFQAAYIRYNPSTDVFEEEPSTVAISSVPLPTNLNASITELLSDKDYNVTAVVDIDKKGDYTFQVTALKDKARWSYTLQWVNGRWKVVTCSPISDGFTFCAGYPPVAVSAATAYLSKLHSQAFKGKFNYVSIESNNIGLDVYIRLVFSFQSSTNKKWGHEAVVKSTYSLQNSHSVLSWKPLVYLRDDDDYGYGKRSSYAADTHGYSGKLFYQDQ